jgi:phosphatidylserine decarboxylase
MVMDTIYVLIALSVIITIVIWFFIFFNRDPERQPPATSNVIVSPADGTVIYIERFDAGNLPVPRKFGREVHLNELVGLNAFPNGGHLIGIYLSPFDIHIVRAPIAGNIVFASHWSGRLFSKELFAFKKTADERSTCIIENDDTRVGVVQMAAYLVRRAVLYARIGDHVRMGERVGRIRLGSQVDLILSNETGLTIATRCGSKVLAGESVVAMLERVSSST